jgi:hypothetical protein
MAQKRHDLSFNVYTRFSSEKNVIDMGIYPYGRQAAAFKSAFATHKVKPQLNWLGNTLIYLLIKQDIRRCEGSSLLPPVCSPSPITRVNETPVRASSGIRSASFETDYSGITPTMNNMGVVSSSEIMNPSTEGSARGTGSPHHSAAMRAHILFHHWTSWQGLLQTYSTP